MSKSAKLPSSYLAALQALRACDRHFTPQAYAFAMMALVACWEADEVATWPQDADALQAYSRMSNDGELMRLAARIERRRAEWRAQLPPVEGRIAT